MKYALLEEVVLTRDIPEQELKAGDLGTIVHVYGGDAFEVEFAMVSGVARAVLTLREGDIRAPSGTAMRAARGVDSAERR